MISFELKNQPASVFLTELLNSKDPDLPYSIFTDPPYGESNEACDKPLKTEEIRSLSLQFYNLANETFLFCGCKTLDLWKSSLKDAGYRYIRTGVWLKPNAYWQPTPYTGGGIEYFVFASKTREGRTCFPAYICSTSGQLKWAEENHPFRKPVPLARQVIRDAFSNNQDGFIVDPFAGSGSFGVAGLLEERFIILNELDGSMLPNIEWRLEHYDLWNSSEPKEGIKVVDPKTDTNQTDDGAEPKTNTRKRGKFSWKEEEIKALCEAMAAHTKRVKAKTKDKGMTEAEFLQLLQGIPQEKNKQGKITKRGTKGLFKRRIAAARIWTKCAWIRKIALEKGQDLRFPKKTQREMETGAVLGFLGLD